MSVLLNDFAVNKSQLILSDKQFKNELVAIADWWIENTIDKTNNGFIGEITATGVVKEKSNRGIVLNTRILWFFSEIALYFNEVKYKEIADRAYHYIQSFFFDHTFGGVVWEVDYQGHCINNRKQIYAQAFAIYALCSYYKLTKNQQVLDNAYALYGLIEKYGHDDTNGGYYEAFSQQWGHLDDVRLSTKDLNYPKTMNTHLHIIEAYTALYSVFNCSDVRQSLITLLGYYHKYFINKDNYHLRMFLDNNWQDHSTTYSYGHDIESSWLIWESVKILGDKDLYNIFKPLVIKLAATCYREGRDDKGAVLDMYDIKNNKNIVERVWWIQAEALVGFLNAYEITGEYFYLEAVAKNWQFICNSIIDHKHGEWHWSSILDQHDSYHHYKMGFWKAPYHNGRAMLEMCKRLQVA